MAITWKSPTVLRQKADKAWQAVEDAKNVLPQKTDKKSWQAHINNLKIIAERCDREYALYGAETVVTPVAPCQYR